MLFDPDRYYRLSQIINSPKSGEAGRIPVCETTWYKGIRQGRYPKGVRISENVVAWRGRDLNEVGGLNTGGEAGEGT